MRARTVVYKTLMPSFKDLFTSERLIIQLPLFFGKCAYIWKILQTHKLYFTKKYVKSSDEKSARMFDYPKTRSKTCAFFEIEFPVGPGFYAFERRRLSFAEKRGWKAGMQIPLNSHHSLVSIIENAPKTNFIS